MAQEEEMQVYSKVLPSQPSLSQASPSPLCHTLTFHKRWNPQGMDCSETKVAASQMVKVLKPFKEFTKAVSPDMAILDLNISFHQMFQGKKTAFLIQGGICKYSSGSGCSSAEVAKGHQVPLVISHQEGLPVDDHV